MSEDRPLTAFTDESGDSEATNEDGVDVDHENDVDEQNEIDVDGDNEAGRDAPSDRERSSSSLPDSTYRWEPDGAVCGQCGSTTERQWVDDGAFFCPACKQWDVS